jgi:carboxypeptidase Q
MWKSKVLVLALSVFGACSLASAQSKVERAMEEAQKPSPLESDLRKLSDEIGGRVTGSPAMDRAVEWGVAAFKAAGADRVVAEKVEIPTGWQEGATQFEVISPSRFRVSAVSLAWAPPLPALHARLVDVGEGHPEDLAKAGNIAGAVLLVHSKPMQSVEDLFEEHFKAPAILDSAVQGKAAAIAFIAAHDHGLLYRHQNIFNGQIDRIPQILLAREDGERIGRLLAAGNRVEAEIAIPNKIGGPASSANVVAELRGSELPNEYVVIGAHLDSWDLGTGALDNGCNSALVIDVLRAIKASGVRPRRTIRFVLFTAEEQGVFGSRAYVSSHRAEMENTAAAIVLDMGAGKILGFAVNGRKELIPVLTPMIAPLTKLEAGLLAPDAMLDTDNFDFLLEGVPNFVAIQDLAPYLPNYHASSDTFDKVDMAVLKKNTVIATGFTVAIADAASRLGPRQSRAEVEALLKENKLDGPMKFLGVWEDWASGKRGRQK